MSISWQKLVNPSLPDFSLQYNHGASFGGHSLFIFQPTSVRLSIGTALGSAKLHVLGAINDANIGYFKSQNGSVSGFAVRGETVNAGSASGVYGDLGVYDGAHWVGVRGYSSTALAPAIKAANTVANGIAALFTGRIGMGIVAPTSDLHINGSLALGVVTLSTTGIVPNNVQQILVNNGAVNITLTLPSASTCLGRLYKFTRAVGSTGTISINSAGGQVQSLTGNLGATTSISAHGASGQGVNICFWSNGTNWYR